MIRSNKKHTSEFLFPLILFFILALMAIMVILLSAKVYSNITKDSSINYSARTSVAYISQKIRRSDSGGRIYPGTIGDIPALIIEQDFNGSTYCTYIYQYEGALKEMFTRSDVTITPASGQTILDIDNFSVEQFEGNLLKISCRDMDGKTAEMLVSIKSSTK